jgi:antitoxin HicB
VPRLRLPHRASDTENQPWEAGTLGSPMATGSHEFEVVLQPEKEGGFSVSVPALPGCHTQGETREEALEMAKDAIEGYLEVLGAEGRPLPQPALIERVTVAA